MSTVASSTIYSPEMNPILDLMRSHRTVRKFKADVPPDDVVREAVAAAQMASTSSNIQAYDLLRVRDPESRAKLVELTGGQPQVAQAGAFFVVAGDTRRHRIAAQRAARHYDPNLEVFLLATIDAALFAQNLALAFESLGLGICFIGGLRNELPEVDALLELPRDVFPLFGLCVGVPADAPALRPRLPVDAVLAEERLPDEAAVGAALDDYDAQMASYYAARGRPGFDWSGAIARKFEKRKREHLLGFYRGKGAVLE